MDMDKPIFPDYVPTIGNLFAAARSQYANLPFLVSDDRELSFSEADAQAAQLARGLLCAGIGKGTRVAILMPNNPDWVLCFMAATRIGALVIPISTLYPPRELDWILRYADIDTILVATHYAGHDYLERLERSLPGLAAQPASPLALQSHPYLRRIIVWGPCDRAWAMHGPSDLIRLSAARPAVDDEFLRSIEASVVPADELLAICTSGTTAEPKVVVHTHGSALRTAHMHLVYKQREVTVGDHGLRDYVGMPLFWLGGININLLPALFEGNCLVFAPSPKVDDILDTLVRHRVTRVSMWQAQKNALLDRAIDKGIDLSLLQNEIAPARDAHGNVLPANRRASSILGMTESFGPHGVEWRQRILPESKAGSLGHPVEGIERRIVDPDSGEVLPTGRVGDLQIRGFSLMQGYYKKERGEVFSADGWFSTGDLCHLDEDGYLFLHGRRNEMIKSMGANIAPREVELQIESLEGVREAMVFGMPDAARGEAVIAVVVPLEGRALQPAQLRAALKDRLSAYKIPGEIMVARDEDIPRTDSGKSRKGELKKLLPALREAAARS